MRTLNLKQLKQDFNKVRRKDPRTALRIRTLISLTQIKLKYSKLSRSNGKALEIESLCQGVERSRRTLERWEASYFEGGLESITWKKSTGRPADPPLSPWAKGKIKSMRKGYRWGSEVIQAHLMYDHDKYITRYKIEKFLTHSSLRVTHPCTTLKRIKHNKKKKHDKKVVVQIPGFHTQMDVKFLMEKCHHAKRLYVYNFIDHASNWSYKRVYKAHTDFNTIDFMINLLRACPFKIYRIQTDNGSEFTNKYMQKLYLKELPEHKLDRFCNEFNILHKCIPVGEKELQGLVERSNRQDDQELYIKFDNDHSYHDIAYRLDKYASWRNQKRRFKKNDWKTPDEYLENFIVGTIAIYMFIQKNKENPPKENILTMKVLQEFNPKKKEEKLDFGRFDEYRLAA